MIIKYNFVKRDADIWTYSLMKIVVLISFVALIFVISSVWGQSEYLEDDIMSEV